MNNKQLLEDACKTTARGHGELQLMRTKGAGSRAGIQKAIENLKQAIELLEKIG